jgi:hypothetical protein
VKQTKYLLLTMAILSAMTSVPLLQAGSLAPVCVTDTLADYDSLFGPASESQCSIGIHNFSSFTFSASGTGSPTLLSDSNIEVTPIFTGDPHALPQSLSLELSGNFSVATGQTATYVINWFYSIDNGPADDGASMGMDPSGAVTVTQVFCPDGGVVGDCNNTQTTLQDTTIPLHLFDSKVFTVANFAEVQTTIFLNGANGSSSFANVTSTSDVINSTAPEPTTVLLGLGGVLSLAGLRKLARRS